MNFIVHNNNGAILRTGTCNQSSFLFQAREGEFVLEGEANDETQMIVDGLIVNKPPVAPPVYNLEASRLIKISEIASARIIANLTSFTYNSNDFSASQIAQNDLNAIANYSSLFNALPPSFPNAWQAIDGTVIAIPDVAAFKALYAAMVAQGAANFIKLQTLLYQASSAATQAELEAVTW